MTFFANSLNSDRSIGNNEGKSRNIASLVRIISVFNEEGVPISWHRWLTPVILATLEAEIKRLTVPGQLGQIVCEFVRLYLKSTNMKKAWWSGSCGRAPA
jgi:hypothetical protein